MLHRFLHLGDLHLGPNDRNDDRIAALDQAIREGLQQPLAAWLWPGDLNHGEMTISDKNVLTGRIQMMANHAPVVVAYGNHDLPGDLDFLAKLNAIHPILVIDRPQVVDVHTPTGADVAIFVLPYPHRSGLVAAGVPSDNLVDAARGALDLIFMSAAAQLAEARAAGMLTMMIGHVNVGGSITSSGQPNIGKEIEIDQALMDRLGAIYVGLNHIHLAQFFLGTAYANYAGSMCRLDWGETEAKRYLTIEYDDLTNFRVISNPLDVAPMYHVEGELTRDGFAWTIPECDCGHCPEHGIDWNGAEVRVRLRFVAADKPLLNFDLVREPFAGAKRLELDPIAEHTRAIRAPEVAAAESLEDKVQAITAGAGVTWTPGLTEKMALLQQPDGVAFLNIVEDRLAGIDADVREEVLL
jgi:DNA repair exonuclease SbcCD nuclease subunit